MNHWKPETVSGLMRLSNHVRTGKAFERVSDAHNWDITQPVDIRADSLVTRFRLPDGTLVNGAYILNRLEQNQP